MDFPGPRNFMDFAWAQDLHKINRRIMYEYSINLYKTSGTREPVNLIEELYMNLLSSLCDLRGA